MPTLVAVLTLVALLKLSAVDMPRWHLAFWFGVLVTLALSGSLFAAFIDGRETLGYLLCFAVTLLLALLATVVARRI